MIPRAGAETIVAGKAQTLATGQTLHIASYKRDRWLEVRRTHEHGFHIIEHGFTSAEHEASRKQLRKLLKKLFKREFPRSNKLHMNVT